MWVRQVSNKEMKRKLYEIGNFMNSFASTPQVKKNKYLVDI